VVEPSSNVDKGKWKVISKMKELVPLRSDPSGIGSSNAFAALDVTQTQDEIPVKDVAANSFSFALQNVTDEVPQRVLPQVDEPILTLVTNEAHDDVLSVEVEITLSVSDDIRSPVAYVLPLIFGELVDVQDNLNEQHVHIILSSSASPQPAHNANLDDSYDATLEPPINTSHVDVVVSEMV